MNKYLALLISISLLFACKHEKKSETIIISVTNLTDQDYPDNPDIGYRSKDYQSHEINFITAENKGDTAMSLAINTIGEEWIKFDHVDLLEFIPSIPNHLKNDEYLSLLAVVNQEWNRNQVRFSAEDFVCKDNTIQRVDIARNCLNSYLWEVIVYKLEDGSIVPYTHCWFDFPKDWYQRMFEIRNGQSFSKYAEYLENWKDPASDDVDLFAFRRFVDAAGNMVLTYKAEVDTMYPLEGARLKKRKEVIFPKDFQTMKDLQSDSTLYATFSQPGFYNRKDPRTTELGRLDSLMFIEINQVVSEADGEVYEEIEMRFLHNNGQDQTAVLIGGVDMDKLPTLEYFEAVNGWKNSMGFSNHTFYETRKEHEAYSSKKSPYYAMLLDGEGKWLDSHKVGIDGPIMYWDKQGLLHIWLLSFERHSLVGHYVLKLDV